MTHARWYTELTDSDQDLLSHHAEMLTDRQYVLGVLREVYARRPWDVSTFAQRELLEMERGWSEPSSAPRVYNISASPMRIVEDAGCNILVFFPKQSADYLLFTHNSARLLSGDWAPIVNEIARELL